MNSSKSWSNHNQYFVQHYPTRKTFSIFKSCVNLEIPLRISLDILPISFNLFTPTPNLRLSIVKERGTESDSSVPYPPGQDLHIIPSSETPPSFLGHYSPCRKQPHFHTRDRGKAGFVPCSYNRIHIQSLLSSACLLIVIHSTMVSAPTLVIRVSEFTSVSSTKGRRNLPSLRLTATQRDFMDRSRTELQIANGRSAACMVKSDGSECLDNVLRAKMKFTERTDFKLHWN